MDLPSFRVWLLLFGVMFFKLTALDGRQMCLSCQYQSPLSNFLPCLEDPWNWPGGNVRQRCNFRCSFEVRRKTETEEYTYAHRGCTGSNDAPDNGCEEVSGEQRCYFTCIGTDYCNNWNASSVVVSGASASPRQWSPLLLALGVLSPVVVLVR